MPLTTVEADTEPVATSGTLVIGTKHAPPFAIKDADGAWEGISIDLWREIAEELQVAFTFEERDLATLLEGVKRSELDAAVSALTINAEREANMDFSHPFYLSGLSIATSTSGENAWIGATKSFFSWPFFQAVLALLALLLLVGVTVWFFEHRRNQQFGGPMIHGVGSGLWWSAVTMTTVGYGDKAPVTVGGRLIALIWMFASIIIISSFTAAFATALTIGRLESTIQGPQDLYRVTTATVSNSTSEVYLRDQRIEYTPFNSLQEALQALADGKVTALVYDQPLLQYLTNRDFRDTVHVLPVTFRRQSYGIALPASSRWRESINRVLLEKLDSQAWQDILFRYLGQTGGA